MKAGLSSCAVLVALFLCATAQAATKQHVLPHPTREHCRAYYVKKTETVKKRKAGRTVKVKETFCVYVAPAPKTEPETGVETGSLGSALFVDNDNLAVTATVQDPVTVLNEFEMPKAGARLVAVHLLLVDEGTMPIQGDANSDTSLIGTDDQAQKNAFGETPGCTDFSYGEFSLLPGSQEEGCVLYELPIGVNVQAVQFAFRFSLEAQWNA